MFMTKLSNPASPRVGLLAMVAASVSLSFAVQVSAQTNTPYVDQRQANQESRIQQGVASGALNEREATRLEVGQAKVDAAEARMKADGKVTKTERARLHHKENKQSARIYRQKHDAQTAATAAANAAK
jgi:hypothetical protein